MIDIDIRIDDKINPGIDRLRRRLEQYPTDAVDQYRRLTPRRSGNARRKTRLNGPNRIELEYAYGEVLDAGRRRQGGRMRGSTQAPQGMTRPFIRWINQYLNRFFRI